MYQKTAQSTQSSSETDTTTYCGCSTGRQAHYTLPCITMTEHLSLVGCGARETLSSIYDAHDLHKLSATDTTSMLQVGDLIDVVDRSHAFADLVHTQIVVWNGMTIACSQDQIPQLKPIV
jgi:hypothetical protein